MPCIYLTINHWNKHFGIEPYLYIGSNQTDNPNYYGSNKRIKEDLSILGKEFFEKQILEFFNDIENVELRKKESLLLEKLDCANNSKYYNRTNNSLPGYRETLEERKNRIKKTHDSRRKNALKRGYYIHPDKIKNLRNHIPVNKGKSLKEFFIKKYGLKIGEEKFKLECENRKKRISKNNPHVKIINSELQNKMIELFLQGKTKKEISILLNVNFWLVERYCTKKIIKFLSGETANIPFGLRGEE